MAEQEQIQYMNIYQKLAKVRKQAEVIQRNKKGYGYTYVSEDEILAKITGVMDKYNLSLVPAIVPGTTEVTPYHTVKQKSTKNGEIYNEDVNEILVRSEMSFSWINNDNPEERVEVPWILVGHQSDASQSFGSGLSYSMRYFLLKFFNIATPNDDPDAWRGKQAEAAAAEDMAIAAEVIKNFDKTVRAYLEAHPDKGEEVKKFISKYVKGGDYFKIKESLVAIKLSKDFANTYSEEAA